MTGGPMEIGLIIFAVLLLFGYKKLPEASRSLGRSLRIFKGEMKGMRDDDRGDEGRATREAAGLRPVPAQVVPPARDAERARLEAEAHEAELRAVEARARAGRALSGDTGR